MIATLNGTVTEASNNRIVLEIQGVGYGVLLAESDYSKVVIDSKLKLYIHEHIKEDQHDLIGFTTIQTKQLFEQLLSVKNVGPKVALSLLDIGGEASVKLAISSGDVKKLQTAKGVGKRAAEQIIVELRDKVGLPTSGDAEDVINRAGINQNDPAVQALIALGYSDFDAQKALLGVSKDISVEDRVKLALKNG